MKKIIKCLNLFVFIYLCFLIFNISSVFASDNDYTDVMYDLELSEDFSVYDYENHTLLEIQNSINDNDSSNDLSLFNVIQIGESDKHELFIYTYEPTFDDHPLYLSSININSDESINGEFQNNTIKTFELILISESNIYPFKKYKVVDYQVSDELYRYYNIISIHRLYDSLIDTDASSTTTEVAHSIGQQWCCYYKNDILNYEMNTFNTIEIYPTLNASVTFSNGYQLASFVKYEVEKCNAHFIAFNLEDTFNIKKIFDADLNYKTRTKTTTIKNGTHTNIVYSNESSDYNYVTLYKTQSVVHKGSGLFAKEFYWDRICSSEDFINNYEDQDGILDESSRNILLNSQWVFSFYESEYTYTVEGSYTSLLTTKVETECYDVQVLRLHFQTPEGVYNLGVVCDKTYTSGIVGSNNTTKLDDFFENFKDLFLILFGLIGIVIIILIFNTLIPIFKIIFEYVFLCFKSIFSLLYKIFSYPFTLIGKLFNRKK